MPAKWETHLEKAKQLRLRQPNREQLTPVPMYLERILADNHLARLVWQAVEIMDLSSFYAQIKVKVKGGGRAAIDPQLMVALWLYGSTQGVTSARELARLCQEHLAYIWLCGGVTINHHSLSDFRVQHREALAQLMDELVVALMEAGLIELSQVAQDGMRVRASAGAASFRREATLKEHLCRAQTVESELLQGDSDCEQQGTPRQQQARARARRERLERLEAAFKELPQARKAKPKDKQDQARVSTTDAEARVMKMPDGGFRPAYNFQLAVDTAPQVIVGVDVTNNGSDKSQMLPMIDQVEARFLDLPDHWLTDGGFTSKESIEGAADKGVCVLAPVPKPKDPERDPHQPLGSDSELIAAWRERMGTDWAKETYKLRAATVECVNAQARCRYGIQQLRVRGLEKVGCVALWMTVAHNLLIWLRHLFCLTPSQAILT